MTGQTRDHNTLRDCNISKTALRSKGPPTGNDIWMEYQMVTWSMTSRDLQRCCDAVRSAILATAWLLVLVLTVEAFSSFMHRLQKRYRKTVQVITPNSTSAVYIWRLCCSNEFLRKCVFGLWRCKDRDMACRVGFNSCVALRCVRWFSSLALRAYASNLLAFVAYVPLRTLRD